MRQDSLFDVTLFKIKSYTLMTTKAIQNALKGGHVVCLKDDPASMLCFDLFGDLVVISRHAEVPTRKATLADIRKATINK